MSIFVKIQKTQWMECQVELLHYWMSWPQLQVYASQLCGVNNIDSTTNKLVKHELSPVITHVVNLSIQQLIFPYQWKKAKAILLHNKEEPIYPKNYRPVSLLPIFSKILERAIFAQVLTYFETNGLLYPSDHGFRQKHSTSTSLVQMIDTFDAEELYAVLMQVGGN